MSENLQNLFENLGQLMPSDDSALVSNESIIEYLKTIRWDVTDWQSRISMTKLKKMLNEAEQSIANHEAAGKRKGVYLRDGQVFADGELVKSLKGRYLEIVIHILQCGEASLSELKLRFWKRNNEGETKDRDVVNTVYNLNKAIKKYKFRVKSKDRHYKIFRTS